MRGGGAGLRRTATGEVRSGDMTGSANRIARAVLIDEPPSIDRGEVTDKGSINQRAVLRHRAALIDALHGDTLPFTIKPRRR